MTLDSNCDGRLGKKELKYSAFGGFNFSEFAPLPAHWNEMNTDGDQYISLTEWSEFFGKLEEQKGEALFRKVSCVEP